ncbi:hypothetical protein [Candidatus Mycoplasma haematohominis]|uniref:Uncharacterized protein n=1 Tax=Candidatus Mycoplasma haematohominis TaxID=1494318 RepID=A0A478FQ78_9MOLU|nr:hypothetical protein [Candidatus Mycoplasma haemohominis]GCE63442.1 hypothetical protein MHSWG343_04390 [Candidatus Mycoplasma haemohominis]
MDPIKLSAGALGVAILAGGSYGIYDAVSWIMPDDYLVLSKCSNKGDYSSDNKAGKDYGRYLIGAYDKQNEKWWNWSYRWWQYDLKNNSNTLDDKFNSSDKIKSAFSVKEDNSADNAKALNKVCEGLYKGNSSDVDPTSGINNLKNNFWKYCSFLGKSPTTVGVKDEKEVYQSGKHGETKKANLISTVDPENSVFWEVRNEEFFGNDAEINGSSADATNDSVFHKLFKTPVGENRGHIRDACKKAYGLSSSESGSDKATEANVLKFCSLKGKE